MLYSVFQFHFNNAGLSGLLFDEIHVAKVQQNPITLA